MNTDTDNVVVGKKQILREMKNGRVTEIRIAVDVELDYAETMKSEARRFGVPYVISSTMRELADEFGIDVPTGAVGKLAD